jgi:hypothetical protein
MAIDPCPIDGNCVEVVVHAPAAPVATGEPAQVRVLFQQAASDQIPGGVDQIAALTLTIGIPGLELADCSAPGSDGLNPSFALLGNRTRYRVVVQNLTCAGTGSCLCPPSGEPAPYINLLVVGTLAAQGVQPLPSGALLGISLRARPGAGPRIPLHIYSSLDDEGELPPPAGSARLSIGDRLAIDRTVDSEDQTLNAHITDAELQIVNPSPTATATATVALTATATAAASATATVAPPTETAVATATAPAPATATATAEAVVCAGDCNHSGEVTINELLTGVGIALDSIPLSSCQLFDCTGVGTVEVSCLIAAVNASLNGCPEQ